MNLFELFVRVGVDDQASDALGKITSGLGKGLATAAKIGTAAVSAAVAGITALTTAAVKNYAEYEQLTGGIATLFEDLNWDVEQNAANAFRTAGLSANEYMSTAMSFAASLNQSLQKTEGSIARSAELTDQAIIDMADNANKMGTSMEMIQNAYSGFAKGNFTMLDNLKLGYGGTREEMERLLADATAISGIEYDISSFADIVEAIHVMQEAMGIAGATAAEAATTISGSVASMKAAWSNLVTGLANDDADLELLIGNFVESVSTVAQNVVPVIQTAVKGLATLITMLAPMIAEQLPTLIQTLLPVLVSSAGQLVGALVEGIVATLPTLYTEFINMLYSLSGFITNELPQMLANGSAMIENLKAGFGENSPSLLDAVGELISSILTFIVESFPDFVVSGFDMIQEFLTGILESAPDVITNVGQLLNNLLSSILSRIPDMLNAGFSLISNLASGLISNLPAIVSSAANIMAQLLATIGSNLPSILQQGLELVAQLAAGIISAIPDLIAQIPQLISSIVSAFSSFDWGSIGKNMMDGVAAGIINGATAIWEAAKNAAQRALQVAKEALGIASPSKKFRDEVGKQMAAGLGLGWEDEFGKVKNDIEESLDFNDVSIGINASVRKMGAETNGSTFGSVSVVQNIYSEAKTAADLMQEALYMQERAVMLGV